MTKIKFTKIEKNALIQFHQDELKKAFKMVEQIKERINILTGKPKRIRRTKAQLAAAAQPKKQVTKRSHHKKEVKSALRKNPILPHKAAVSTGKREHVKWAEFIPRTLKQHGKALTTREILNLAGKKFHISTGRKEMKSLSQTLRNMRKAGRLTAATKAGQSKKFYSVVS